MIRVTVELLPGGDKTRARTLGTAYIGRVSGRGESATYEALVSGTDLLGGCRATIADYPRYSSSVWDLVLRSVTKALTFKERLPKRPGAMSKRVPIRVGSAGMKYVRFADIPEPAHTLFAKNMAHSTCPIVEGDPDPMGCVYAWDWIDWLNGSR